jgi:hypothetical protein
VPSVSGLRPSRLLLPACFAVAAGLLAGCTTTQQQAARDQLNSARLRAAQYSTRVSRANPSVPASVEAVIRSDQRTAFVVTISNRGGRVVSDLPISVGYRGAGGSVYLNGAAGTNYYASHLPAIHTGRSITWVYTTGKQMPAGATAFAYVGRRPTVPASVEIDQLPLGIAHSGTTDGSVLVHLHNATSVPQYQLPVVAYALKAGQYVAAATGSVTDLGAGSSASLHLRLVGSAPDDALHVTALPTILQ